MSFKEDPSQLYELCMPGQQPLYKQSRAVRLHAGDRTEIAEFSACNFWVMHAI